jgi:hypothetical protein
MRYDRARQQLAGIRKTTPRGTGGFPPAMEPLPPAA